MAVLYRYRPVPIAALIVVLIGLPVVDCGRAAEGAAPQAPSPRIWIVMGLPGDAQRHERYLQTVETIRGALIQRFSIAPEDITVLFGGNGSSPYPACDATTLTTEMDRVAESAAGGRPSWVFFLGHADTREGRTTYHIAGADISSAALGRRLRQARGPGHVTLVLTMACSGDFLAALAGRNRTLVAAAPPATARNETECPHLLADILTNPEAADGNADGKLSINELTAALRQEIATWYRTRELIRTEYPLADGNGDGSVDPAQDGDDIRSASAVTLTYTSLPADSKE